MLVSGKANQHMSPNSCLFQLTSHVSRLASRVSRLTVSRRPPYGDVDNRIRTIAQALNLTTIIWSHDTVSGRGHGDTHTRGIGLMMVGPK